MASLLYLLARSLVGKDRCGHRAPCQMGVALDLFPNGCCLYGLGAKDSRD